MGEPLNESELEAYLDEALPAEAMQRVEEQLRQDESLRQGLSLINSRRDGGVHTLGEIWRRNRLSCPSREQLGSLLLGAMPKTEEDYLRFHLETVGCRYCQANLADLESQRSGADKAAQNRRKKYFQSSAGYLRKDA